MWVTFTLTRLDRLHARVDAARAALDAQLVRRSAALLETVESPDALLPAAPRAEYEATARAALAARSEPGAVAVSDGRPAAGPRREALENGVGRVLADLAGRPVTLLPPGAVAELREAAARV